MDYLTGHIRSAWLLAGCSSACFSPLLLPSVPVWQLAHLIYLIGLVQSVGNVLKANQGDGGTSAGDIVSRVWKEVEQLQRGTPRLPVSRSNSQASAETSWRRSERRMTSVTETRVHSCTDELCDAAPTEPTLLSQVQSASCLRAETLQANTLNVLQDNNIWGWTGQHRAAPGHLHLYIQTAPGLLQGLNQSDVGTLMWHTWAN